MKTYKKLKFVELREFDLWDIKRYTSEKLKSTFNIEKLSNCIKEENRKYKLYLEEDKTFGILGVNNKEGIFDAYEQKGKEINQPYKKMEIGWLAYNPYRINVGSIGIRKKAHLYEYISPAYVVFSCLDNLLPDYLYLLFKTERFIKIINESTTGSVRQNLTSEILKTLEIPLPSLSEQETIVKSYYDKIEQAVAWEQEADALEKNIETYLFESLGIEEKTEGKTKKKGLQFVELREMDRWDIFSINEQRVNSKYSKLKFGDIILGKPTYGANVKGVKKKSDTRYIRITDINENGTLNDDFVSPEFIEEKYLLKENDFLIARSGNTVGKTFLYDDSYGRAIYAGYLVKYKLDLNIVSPQYILAYTKFSLFKQWVVSNQRVSGQPNINGQEYLEAPFIVPPLPKQNEIVATIATMKQEQKNKIERATLLKQQAEQEFEQTIFS